MNTVPLPGVRVAFRERASYRRAQRVVDITIATIALLLTSPLLIGAALAIRIEDNGPIFFRPAPGRALGALFHLIQIAYHAHRHVRRRNEA